MGTENTLWKRLEKVKYSGMHLQRVENTCKSGVPDVEGCAGGKQFWLELKAGPSPKTDCAMVNCEPLKAKQLKFFRDRINAGGAVWLLYRVGDGVGAVLYLVNGNDAPGAAPRPTVQWLKKHTQCGPQAGEAMVLFLISRHS